MDNFSRNKENKMNNTISLICSSTGKFSKNLNNSSRFKVKKKH